ncbi:MAG: AAA family ATPase [Candidatus Alkanophagales archaeon]
MAKRDPESGKLRLTYISAEVNPRSFVSALGEALYFHPSAVIRNLIWEYFRKHWVEFRSVGLPSVVARRISERVFEEYDDFLFEPFIGEQLTFYMRTRGGRGVRLGDVGDGVQVVATMMLLYEFVKPKTLLIDDVEAHMNPSLLTLLTSWLEDVLERGTRVVLSTHSLEAAKFVADVLKDYDPQITLLTLHDGVLKTRNLKPEEVEGLEAAGLDVRLGADVLV